MTAQQMKKQIRALGCTVKLIDGEIRVNVRGGTEATAYYTICREDAVATARAMAKERDAARVDLPASAMNTAAMIGDDAATSAIVGPRK